MDPASLDLPDTNYKFIAPGLGFRIPIGRSVAFMANGSAMLISDAGQISGPIRTARRRCSGVETQAGLDILSRQAVRGAAHRRVHADRVPVQGDGGVLAKNRDGDPTTRDVGGAADRSFGGGATLAVAVLSPRPGRARAASATIGACSWSNAASSSSPTPSARRSARCSGSSARRCARSRWSRDLDALVAAVDAETIAVVDAGLAQLTPELRDAAGARVDRGARRGAHAGRGRGRGRAARGRLDARRRAADAAPRRGAARDRAEAAPRRRVRAREVHGLGRRGPQLPARGRARPRRRRDRARAGRGRGRAAGSRRARWSA